MTSSLDQMRQHRAAVIVIAPEAARTTDHYGTDLYVTPTGLVVRNGDETWNERTDRVKFRPLMVLTDGFGTFKGWTEADAVEVSAEHLYDVADGWGLCESCGSLTETVSCDSHATLCANCHDSACPDRRACSAPEPEYVKPAERGA